MNELLHSLLAGAFIVGIAAGGGARCCQLRLRRILLLLLLLRQWSQRRLWHAFFVVITATGTEVIFYLPDLRWSALDLSTCSICRTAGLFRRFVGLGSLPTF